jgi:hypothetical protein
MAEYVCDASLADHFIQSHLPCRHQPTPQCPGNAGKQTEHRAHLVDAPLPRQKRPVLDKVQAAVCRGARHIEGIGTRELPRQLGYDLLDPMSYPEVTTDQILHLGVYTHLRSKSSEHTFQTVSRCYD